jgi:hypothetical protein
MLPDPEVYNAGGESGVSWQHSGFCILQAAEIAE